MQDLHQEHARRDLRLAGRALLRLPARVWTLRARLRRAERERRGADGGAGA